MKKILFSLLSLVFILSLFVTLSFGGNGLELTKNWTLSKNVSYNNNSNHGVRVTGKKNITVNLNNKTLTVNNNGNHKTHGYSGFFVLGDGDGASETVGHSHTTTIKNGKIVSKNNARYAISGFSNIVLNNVKFYDTNSYFGIGIGCNGSAFTLQNNSYVEAAILWAGVGGAIKIEKSSAKIGSLVVTELTKKLGFDIKSGSNVTINWNGSGRYLTNTGIHNPKAPITIIGVKDANLYFRVNNSKLNISNISSGKAAFYDSKNDRIAFSNNATLNLTGKGSGTGWSGVGHNSKNNDIRISFSKSNLYVSNFKTGVSGINIGSSKYKTLKANKNNTGINLKGHFITSGNITANSNTNYGIYSGEIKGGNVNVSGNKIGIGGTTISVGTVVAKNNTAGISSSKITGGNVTVNGSNKTTGITKTNITGGNVTVTGNKTGIDLSSKKVINGAKAKVTVKNNMYGIVGGTIKNGTVVAENSGKKNTGITKTNITGGKVTAKNSATGVTQTAIKGGTVVADGNTTGINLSGKTIEGSKTYVTVKNNTYGISAGTIKNGTVIAENSGKKNTGITSSLITGGKVTAKGSATGVMKSAIKGGTVVADGNTTGINLSGKTIEGSKTYVTVKNNTYGISAGTIKNGTIASNSNTTGITGTTLSTGGKVTVTNSANVGITNSLISKGTIVVTGIGKDEGKYGITKTNITGGNSTVKNNTTGINLSEKSIRGANTYVTVRGNKNGIVGGSIKGGKKISVESNTNNGLNKVFVSGGTTDIFNNIYGVVNSTISSSAKVNVENNSKNGIAYSRITGGTVEVHGNKENGVVNSIISGQNALVRSYSNYDKTIPVITYADQDDTGVEGSNGVNGDNGNTGNSDEYMFIAKKYDNIGIESICVDCFNNGEIVSTTLKENYKINYDYENKKIFLIDNLGNKYEIVLQNNSFASLIGSAKYNGEDYKVCIEIDKYTGNITTKMSKMANNTEENFESLYNLSVPIQYDGNDSYFFTIENNVSAQKAKDTIISSIYATTSDNRYEYLNEDNSMLIYNSKISLLNSQNNKTEIIYDVSDYIETTDDDGNIQKYYSLLKGKVNNTGDTGIYVNLGTGELIAKTNEVVYYGLENTPGVDVTSGNEAGDGSYSTKLIDGSVTVTSIVVTYKDGTVQKQQVLDNSCYVSFNSDENSEDFGKLYLVKGNEKYEMSNELKGKINTYGDVTIVLDNECNVESAVFDTGAGSVNLFDTSINTEDIEVTVGEESKYAYSKLKLDNNNGFTAKKDGGDVYLTNVKVTYNGTTTDLDDNCSIHVDYENGSVKKYVVIWSKDAEGKDVSNRYLIDKITAQCEGAPVNLEIVCSLITETDDEGTSTTSIEYAYLKPGMINGREVFQLSDIGVNIGFDNSDPDDGGGSGDVPEIPEIFYCDAKLGNDNIKIVSIKVTDKNNIDHELKGDCNIVVDTNSVVKLYDDDHPKGIEINSKLQGSAYYYNEETDEQQGDKFGVTMEIGTKYSDIINEDGETEREYDWKVEAYRDSNHQIITDLSGLEVDINNDATIDGDTEDNNYFYGVKNEESVTVNSISVKYEYNGQSKTDSLTNNHEILVTPTGETYLIVKEDDKEKERYKLEAITGQAYFNGKLCDVDIKISQTGEITAVLKDGQNSRELYDLNLLTQNSEKEDDDSFFISFEDDLTVSAKTGDEVVISTICATGKDGKKYYLDDNSSVSIDSDSKVWLFVDGGSVEIEPNLSGTTTDGKPVEINIEKNEVWVDTGDVDDDEKPILEKKTIGQMIVKIGNEEIKNLTLDFNYKDEENGNESATDDIIITEDFKGTGFYKTKFSGGTVYTYSEGNVGNRYGIHLGTIQAGATIYAGHQVSNSNGGGIGISSSLISGGTLYVHNNSRKGINGSTIGNGDIKVYSNPIGIDGSTINGGSLSVLSVYDNDNAGAIGINDSVIGTTTQYLGTIEVKNNETGIKGGTINVSSSSLTIFNNTIGVDSATINKYVRVEGKGKIAGVVGIQNSVINKGAEAFNTERAFNNITVTGGKIYTYDTSEKDSSNFYGIYNSTLKGGTVYAVHNSTGIYGTSIFEGATVYAYNNYSGIEDGIILSGVVWTSSGSVGNTMYGIFAKDNSGSEIFGGTIHANYNEIGIYNMQISSGIIEAAHNRNCGISGNTITGGSIDLFDNNGWGANYSKISGGTVVAYRNKNATGIGNSTISANAFVISYNNGSGNNGKTGFGFFQDTIKGGTVKTSLDGVGNAYGIYTSEISGGEVYACNNSTGIAGGTILSNANVYVWDNGIGIDHTVNYRVERVTIDGGTIDLKDNTERSIKNSDVSNSSITIRVTEDSQAKETNKVGLSAADGNVFNSGNNIWIIGFEAGLTGGDIRDSTVTATGNEAGIKLTTDSLLSMDNSFLTSSNHNEKGLLVTDGVEGKIYSNNSNNNENFNGIKLNPKSTINITENEIGVQVGGIKDNKNSKLIIEGMDGELKNVSIVKNKVGLQATDYGQITIDNSKMTLKNNKTAIEATNNGVVEITGKSRINIEADVEEADNVQQIDINDTTKDSIIIQKLIDNPHTLSDFGINKSDLIIGIYIRIGYLDNNKNLTLKGLRYSNFRRKIEKNGFNIYDEFDLYEEVILETSGIVADVATGGRVNINRSNIYVNNMDSGIYGAKIVDSYVKVSSCIVGVSGINKQGLYGLVLEGNNTGIKGVGQTATTVSEGYVTAKDNSIAIDGTGGEVTISNSPLTIEGKGKTSGSYGIKGTGVLVKNCNTVIITSNSVGIEGASIENSGTTLMNVSNNTTGLQNVKINSSYLTVEENETGMDSVNITGASYMGINNNKVGIKGNVTMTNTDISVIRNIKGIELNNNTLNLISGRLTLANNGKNEERIGVQADNNSTINITSMTVTSSGNDMVHFTGNSKLNITASTITLTKSAVITKTDGSTATITSTAIVVNDGTSAINFKDSLVTFSNEEIGTLINVKKGVGNITVNNSRIEGAIIGAGIKNVTLTSSGIIAQAKGSQISKLTTDETGIIMLNIDETNNKADTLKIGTVSGVADITIGTLNFTNSNKKILYLGVEGEGHIGTKKEANQEQVVVAASNLGLTGNNIKLSDNFSETGGYKYRLEYANNNTWTLINDGPSTKSQVASKVPSLTNAVVTAGLNSLTRRLGDIRRTPQDKLNGVWTRVYGRNDKFTKDIETKMEMTGAEGGYDRQVMTDKKDRYYVGAMVGYQNINKIETKKKTVGTKQSGEGTAPSVGVYGTWIAENGLFADITVRNFWISLDMNETIKGCKPYRNQIAVSGEFGKEFKVYSGSNSTVVIEPKTEWVYSYAGSANSKQLEYGATNSIKGKIGFMLGLNAQTTGGINWQPYIEAGYSYEFDNKTEVSYLAYKATEDLSGGYGDVGIGLNAYLGKGFSGYSLVSYEKGSDQENFVYNVGFRYGF